jgi:hypothetical protein
MPVVDMIGYIGFLVTLAVVTSVVCAMLRASASRLRDAHYLRASRPRHVPTGHAKPGFGLDQ